MTFHGSRPSMEDDNEDNLKNKEDLHIAGRHTALDILRFAVFFFFTTKCAFNCFFGSCAMHVFYVKFESAQSVYLIWRLDIECKPNFFAP